MMRFMRNRRKASGKKGQSGAAGGEVADGGETSGPTAASGSAGNEVILTGVRAKDPDDYGATGYTEPEGAGEPGEQPDKPASPAETNGLEEGVKMAVIPEESGGDEETQEATEREIAAEPNYAYPEGESESVEDGESDVTVIEKKGESEMESDNQYTYATVNKPSPRLRVKAEQLDDRYTPDKEFLGNGEAPKEEQGPMVRSEVEGNSADEEEGGQPQKQPREEDFYIYVSEDALQKPRTSPIEVEPTLSTFDSPERQDSMRERDRKRVGEGLNREEGIGDPERDPRREYIRQNSAPAHPGAADPSEDDRERYGSRYDPEVERYADPNFDPRREAEIPRKFPRGYDRPMDYDNDTDRGSDRDYPVYPTNDYDSDRSDHDNYRSYERRGPRHRDDPRMIIRRSPSGGFIERTNSMPTIRHERRRPHGYYPPHRPHGYAYPHERRPRSHRRPNPDYDPYRDSNYRRPYHDRRGVPEPYQNGYPPKHGHHPKPYPHHYTNGYPPKHDPHSPRSDMRQAADPYAAPIAQPQNQAPLKATPNGDAFKPLTTTARGSPAHSAASNESQERSGRPKDQRVSFKDDEGNLERQSEDDTHKQYPEIIAEDGIDSSGKALLSKTKDDDAVSLGSQASDMSADELRPKRLMVRRSVAIWFAWFCMGFFTEVVDPNIPYMKDRINGTYEDMAISLGSQGAGMIFGSAGSRWFCHGFFTEVVGPNIPYLKDRINGTYEDMAISLGARGAGMVLGSAVGGLLCEVSPHWLDLWISTSLVLGALCTSAVPWSLNLLHLCLTLGLSGFSKGFLQVATITLAFSLWSERGAMYVVFLVYMAYAVGAAPCAQLAFLFDTGVLEQLLLGPNSTTSHSDQLSNNGHDVIYSAEWTQDANDNKKEEILGLLDYIPRPMYPFDIAAVLTFVCGAVFLGFFGSAIRSVPRVTPAKSKKVRDIEKQRLEGVKPNRWFLDKSCGFRAVLSIVVFFLLPMGIMSIFGGFHHLYLLTNNSDLLKPQALLLQTIFWGAVAMGRLITPVTTRCISPNGLTLSCITMSILSTALMSGYGEKYPIFIWIFTLLLGIFSGPMLPAGLTLCNLCIRPSAMGIAVAFFWQAIGDGAFAFTAGYLLQYFPSQYLIYTSLASVGAAFLLYLPIIPVLAKNKWQKKPKKKSLKGKAIG